LTTWHCILSAELTKLTCRLFFGDFAHWVNTTDPRPILLKADEKNLIPLIKAPYSN